MKTKVLVNRLPLTEEDRIALVKNVCPVCGGGLIREVARWAGYCNAETCNWSCGVVDFWAYVESEAEKLGISKKEIDEWIAECHREDSL